MEGRSARRQPGSARRLAVAAVLLIASWGGVARTTAADPALMTPPTPADGGPVVVEASFVLRDLNEIDDETETFEFDGVLVLAWRDERLAFDPAVLGVEEMVYQGAYQFNEVFAGWFPQASLMNESGLYERSGILLRIRPDGSLRYVETVNADAKSRLDLRPYPFDAQRLEARFELLGFDRDEVVLRAVELVDGSEAALESVRPSQWEVTGVSSAVRDLPAPYAGESGVASTFVVSIDVERKSLFMMRLVVVPLLVIVVLSWSVFWMEKSSLGDRVSVSFIGILTVVAYQIVLSEILPRISYMTLMNGFLNVSFFIVCTSVVISLWVGELDKSGRSDVGDRVDRRCRWIFPLAYVSLLLLVGLLTGAWVA